MIPSFKRLLLPLLVLLVLNLVKTYRMAADMARQEEEQAVRELVEAARKKKAEASDEGSAEDH